MITTVVVLAAAPSLVLLAVLNRRLAARVDKLEQLIVVTQRNQKPLRPGTFAG